MPLRGAEAGFSSSAAPTGLFTSANTTIGTVNFTAGAPSYTITLGDDLRINTSVVNSAGVNQVITTGVRSRTLLVSGATETHVSHDLSTDGGTVLLTNGSAGGYSACLPGPSGRFAMNGSAASVTIGSLMGSGLVRNVSATPVTRVIGGFNTSTTFGGIFSENSGTTTISAATLTLRNTTAAAGAFPFMDMETRRTQFFLGSDGQMAGFATQGCSWRAEARQGGIEVHGFRLRPVAALQFQRGNNQDTRKPAPPPARPMD